MRLVDLHPRFVGAGGEGISDANGNPVPARHGIGVMFDCPCGCDELCFIPFSNPLDGGVSVSSTPGQPTWDRVGDTFETLTLTPSIQRVGGCAWHGHVTNGGIVA